MKWLPTVSEEVANKAAPALMVLVPSVVVPSLKVTVPVAPLGTVAVKLTGVPNVLGFAELVRVVVLLARFTVWLTAVLVLLAKLLSPP